MKSTDIISDMWTASIVGADTGLKTIGKRKERAMDKEMFKELDEALDELTRLQNTSCRDCEHFGDWHYCKDCYGYDYFKSEEER